ncbi:MAG: DMT family transporter [Candidatus Helarchaeota archaeon]
MDKKSTIYLIISAILWGSMFPFVEYNIQTLKIHFSVVYFIRFCLGSISFLLIMIISKRVKIFRFLMKKKLPILAGLFNGLSVLISFFGQTITISGKAALLLNLNFIWVSILSIIIFKKKLNILKILSLIFGGIGAFILTIGFDFSKLFYGNIIGDLAIIIASFLWSLHVIINKIFFNKVEKFDIKIFQKKITPFDVTNVNIFIAFIISSCSLLIFVNIDKNYLIIPYNLISWISLIHIGISSTTIAYLFYNKGLKKSSPIVASIILLLEVVIASLIGMVLLLNKQYQSVDFIIGAICIFSAIILCNIRNKNE